MGGARVLTVIALTAVGIAAAVLLFTGREVYELRLTFDNAGRLVKGGQVQVAGRKVGSITRIALSGDNRAEVRVRLTDDDVVPLHAGTRARIRAVGAGTLANNFIDLRPGPDSGATIPDGGALRPEQTDGIVDLDAILSSLDPPTRRSLRDLAAGSAEIFAGSAGPRFNRMLEKLSPAVAAIDGLSSELATDRARLGRLIDTATRAATTIRSRRGDLRQAVANTARGLDAIADERSSLEHLFVVAPDALRTGETTLRHLGEAVTALRPTLRAVPAAAAPLDTFLGRTTVAAQRSLPALRDLRAQFPDLRSALESFRPLAGPAERGLAATKTGLADSKHIIRGLRFYGADIIIGIFNGLLGITAGNYNKAGHYAHVTFAQPFETFFGQGLNPLFQKPDYGLFDIKTKIHARCPGGGNPATPDGSSPVPLPDGLCDPADNLSDQVNVP